ncbi:MAG: 3-dehydroquinate dehydratase [Clostridium sp.]|nr:3-dehydroquinate dehydratase [Prevotella sp.]MCM1428435.1 3-dehydroquinate dehydratase [Clostridium sp.]MCM1474900.1 3-dehydroquinate dehydratase [Muribaculaceae bacterium]
MKVFIINGPNLNRLGLRDPEYYGSSSLNDINNALDAEFPDVALLFFQSNSEGEIINQIQLADDEARSGGDVAGIVINPGAYAHYSYAIADAIRDCSVPVIEVHLSNVNARDQWRRNSVTAEAATALISGIGISGYRAAIGYLVS